MGEMDKIYVLACNINQFMDFVRESRKPLSQFIWLHDPDQLRGLLNPFVVKTGTYFELNNIEEIEKEIERRKVLVSPTP